MKSMRLVYFIQLAIMLPILLVFIAQPFYLGTLFAWAIAAVLVLVSGGYAAWASYRDPAARGFALASILTSAVCLGAPFAMQALGLPPLRTELMIAASLLIAALALVFALANRQRWQPGGFFSGRKINTGLLVAILLSLTLIWLPFLIWLATGQASEIGNSRSNDSATRAAFLIYYGIVSLPSLVVVVFGVLFASVALVRAPGSRLIHFGQLTGSLVLLASLFLVASGIGLAMTNPG